MCSHSSHLTAVEGLDPPVVCPAYGCSSLFPTLVPPVQAQDQERPPQTPLRAGTAARPHHPRTHPPGPWHLLAVHPGRPPPTAGSPRHRTPIPTGSAGSSFAAPFLRTRSCTIAAASTPAGIPTICRWSPIAFKRKTHCKHGHPLSGDNLRTNPRTGARVCRACLRDNQRRLRATAGRIQASDSSSTRKIDKSDKSGRPRVGPRSVFERLVDRMVLGRCHPELGTCWVFTGPLTPMGGLVKAPSDSSTAWAGSSYAARYPTAWNFTIGVASMPAGIPTICSSLPTPRIWRTGARRTVSAVTRCQVPTYGSTQGLARGVAVSAAPNTSERFASARRRPSDQDDDHGATEHRR
jgi:hypothetical protein